MKLLKENKASSSIDETLVVEGLISSIKKGSLKSDPTVVVMFIIFRDTDGDVHNLTVKDNDSLKAGLAVAVQTKWNKDSKFGANVSTNITNI